MVLSPDSCLHFQCISYIQNILKRDEYFVTAWIYLDRFLQAWILNGQWAADVHSCSFSSRLVFAILTSCILFVPLSHLTSRASTQGHHLLLACLQHWEERGPWTLGVHLVTPLLPSYTSCRRTSSPTPNCCTITSHRTGRWTEASHFCLFQAFSVDCTFDFRGD